MLERSKEAKQNGTGWFLFCSSLLVSCMFSCMSRVIRCDVLRLTGCERIPACLSEKRTGKEEEKEKEEEEEEEGEVKMAAQLGLLPGRPREKYKE